MASGFSFGAAAPQPQQQQQQPQNTSLFGSTPIATATPNFGTPVASTGPAPSLFGTNPTSSAAAPTGFSFSTPATAQRQPQTGFSLGTGLTAATTSAPATSFSFGGGIGGSAPATAATVAPTQPTGAVPTKLFAQQTPAPGTTSFGGLGGIPSTGVQRISSLALGADPATGWPPRAENKAVLELPVPPEIMAAVEDLKNHMKNQKAVLAELNRISDFDIDSVTEQLEDVRMALTSLLITMHKQELTSAAIVRDMAEISKDVDLLSQARDIPAYGYSGQHQMMNYLYNLIDSYGKRMAAYKIEIERAEFSLQTIVGAMNTNAKDLWDSLTATKDSLLFFAAQIQELHEELRNEMNVHKNISQVVFGSQPKPWLSKALSGNLDVADIVSPLEKVFANPCPAKRQVSAASIDSVVKRTYSMFGRVPSVMDSRNMPQPSADAYLQSPARDIRSSSNVGLSYSPSYHSPGAFMGQSSPAPNSSLKRSKK